MMKMKWYGGAGGHDRYAATTCRAGGIDTSQSPSCDFNSCRSSKPMTLLDEQVLGDARTMGGLDAFVNRPIQRSEWQGIVHDPIGVTLAGRRKTWLW